MVDSCFTCGKEIPAEEEHFTLVIHRERRRKGEEQVEILSAMVLMMWCKNCFDETISIVKSGYEQLEGANP